MRAGSIAIIFSVLATAATGSAVEISPIPVGAAVPDLQFKDIRYLNRSLRELCDKQTAVLVFSNTSCPIAQKYWPKLKRLSETYAARGVIFAAINASDGDSISDVAQEALDFSLPFPVLKDSDGSCARALGATRTPQAIVLDADRRIRYRGRIDDQHRLGGSRPSATSDDLIEALDAILAGRDPVQAETPVDGCVITLPAPIESSRTVTFSEHVAPLLDAHCVECHRPNGGGPFSLITYDDAAKHAAMVAEVVADLRMPPWYASRHQHFVNQSGLSRRERETILTWTRNRQRGDDSKRPPIPKSSDGEWEIGAPDLVTTSLQEHSLPAEGFIDYRYDVLPYVFLKETWISAAEIKPSNPAVVHHCNLGYMSLGEEFSEQNFITGRVPGGTAMVLEDGVAFRIPAGSVVGLQIHYTTTGKPEKNRMSVGFNFPRIPVQRELHHLQVHTSRFAIPPGAASHEVKAVRTLKDAATGVGMFAHMHVRGKDMTFRAISPEGQSETILSIPNYHYDWQQNYRWAPGTKAFPAGTKIEVTAHFDNSKFNPFNPDPTKTVRFGQQTVDEMMYGFFFYTRVGEALNLKVDPKTGQKID
jgi:thiol-disulfide isomerase/thioredoxin